MRLYRGRAPTIEADRVASARLLERVGVDGDSAVRVWVPHRQVAFGRRDVRRGGFDRAREIARDRGFPPVEREVGGRAVAYDGETTIAFARADPVDDFREGLDDRYERTTAAVERALSRLGLETVRGEPDDAFCPGSHSLSMPASSETRAEDERLRKVVGIAQRVRQDAAVTAGIVVVANRDELAGVLETVYEALELSFDSDAVGALSVEGRIEVTDVRRALETALVADERPRVRSVAALADDPP
ncbi:lipoate--protein ligase family protein [Natrarchaeobius sp. A-rgal3]|uniref:lipoyl protein ligase domain-containing protein n=1 Tax=Natrarchaeobius versutus TaxID=1679078 RepID=UPI003510602C